MDVSSTSASEQNPQGHISSASVAPALAPEKTQTKKRNGCPGVRVVGGRIYDSQNGKTCHQCRQKTMDIMASCKNEKQCNLKYCHKCLLNRYEWFCPRCRAICNCSCCRKKSGQQPTGILVHTAKSTGFASVSEMLIVHGSDVQSVKESACVIRKKGKENSDLNCDEETAKMVNAMDRGVIISNKRKRKSKKDKEGIPNEDVPNVEIPLPKGSILRSVANIELQPEETGHALQFLEFCAAFEEILELKKDEPEYILQELIRGGGGCIGRSSPVAQFLIRLLTLIQTDSGESSNVITHRLNHKTSWLHALHKCISITSTFISGNLKLDRFDGGVHSYESLNSTERLTLVNFVCDEVLCTRKVRNWMEEQKLKCVEEEKVTKDKIVAAKQKEKQLKQKMKDELAEAVIAKNGVHLSISEHTTIVSQFKVQTDQAHAEMMESKEMLCTEKQHCISVRTKPILMDNEGRTFWRLKGDESNILLQGFAFTIELHWVQP
ncbi:uncharacterized protein LOC124916095 [Impatiens glandulifera]|uniref:uncharacterized protein LOC124916095 n=1 Tax=Impatiens glandulifera TaxID=253017 RepID=UPI001FB0B37F|nr:uncharacterized protein LOC124916095 [Impatiens glandulifera]